MLPLPQFWFRWRPGALWLTLPGLAYLLIFLLLPCLRLLSLSIQDTDTGDFSLAAYARAFGVPVYTRILGTTFAIAFDVTLLCLVLGYPVAYWLSRQPKRRQRLLGLLVLFPSWMWHGTVPFSGGEQDRRLTIAFDVVPV